MRERGGKKGKRRVWKLSIREETDFLDVEEEEGSFSRFWKRIT
jgi:hypothetical protein